jgi:alpha-ribazole phosphatase
MNLYLIRHTRTDVPAGICYGRSDVATADTFHDETDIIRNKLGQTVFTHCFTSPLERCIKLAAELSGNLIVNKDERLMEMNFGKWENLPWSEIYETEAAKIWFKDYINISCPGGESFRQLTERIHSFLKYIKTLPGDLNILVVTHAGCIRAALTILDDKDPSTIFGQAIDYGEICEIKFDPDKLVSTR